MLKGVVTWPLWSRFEILGRTVPLLKQKHCTLQRTGHSLQGTDVFYVWHADHMTWTRSHGVNLPTMRQCPFLAHFGLMWHMRLSSSIVPTCVSSDLVRWIYPVLFMFYQLTVAAWSLPFLTSHCETKILSHSSSARITKSSSCMPQSWSCLRNATTTCAVKAAVLQ